MEGGLYRVTVVHRQEASGLLPSSSLDEFTTEVFFRTETFCTMEIIAYGTVAKPPTCLLHDHENGTQLWAVALVVDQDCDSQLAKPGYYQVMLTESHVARVREGLKTGAPVLVRGQIAARDPSDLDAEWNHRIVTAESLDLLHGTLRLGRSFRLPVELETVTE